MGPSRALEEQSGRPAHASVDGLVEGGLIVLGGPLADERRVVHVVEAEIEGCYPRHGRMPSAPRIRATPWSETHLQIDTIDPWRIRLDGRHT
jgi:hypothetical protein